MAEAKTAPLKIDYRLALYPRVKGGVAPEALDTQRPHAEEGVKQVLAQVEASKLGFWNLPDDEALAESCADLGAQLKDRFETLVVLGIGGSSLGGRTLVEALAPGANVRFLDNVDPEGFERALAGLDLEKTCFNVISKSGGTVETAAQLCVVRDRLLAKFGHDGMCERLVATTDPEKGLMHSIAEDEGLRTLPVPQNVGGRFSVLSAVGLLPAAFAGVDVKALLTGAREMRERCARSEMAKNPAALGAALHVIALRSDRPVHVMMPYCDRLRPFAEWYGQLWAESLGKALDRAGRAVHVGPTPVAALGTTDQHSQVQLYMEGPVDKMITFLAVDDPGAEVAFPDDVPEGYAYLKGHSMAELFDAERRGTALALARAGRPSLTVHLSSVSAHSLGQLLFLYQAQTAVAGELLDIDAFDQPGVELGKKIAFALMGREGYAEQLAGMEELQAEAPGEVLAD